MRGRKPLPDNVKALRGTDQPIRMNPDAPTAGVDALQFIPDELTAEAKKHWAVIRPMLVKAGVATNLDRPALIMLCEAWATFLEATNKVRSKGILVQGRHGEPVRNPYLRVMNDSIQQLQKLFAEFGMTPSSRTRLRAGDLEGNPRGGSRNDFDDLDD